MSVGSQVILCNLQTNIYQQALTVNSLRNGFTAQMLSTDSSKSRFPRILQTQSA